MYNYIFLTWHLEQDREKFKSSCPVSQYISVFSCRHENITSPIGVQSTLQVDSLVPLMYHNLSDLGVICLVKKHKIHFWILSVSRIQSWIFLKKRTLSFELLVPYYVSPVSSGVFPSG